MHGFSDVRQHATGIYFGAGVIWRATRRWTVEGRLLSYDRDEFAATIGARYALGRKLREACTASPWRRPPCCR
jgi:hypothetical protein